MPAKLTPWFPADVKPVHLGVYETKSGEFKGFQKWNGTYWSVMDEDPEWANSWNAASFFHSRPSWRGLAEKPG